MNTVIVAVSITILSLAVYSMAGYAFAKFVFPGRDKLFMGLLGTLMVPGQITIDPSLPASQENGVAELVRRAHSSGHSGRLRNLPDEAVHHDYSG